MLRFHVVAMPLLIAAVSLPASAANALRAPWIAPSISLALDPFAEKNAPAAVDDRGRLRVGTVRALPKAIAVASWIAVDHGYVARIEASSPDARGLRVKLELGAVPGTMEARVVGSDGHVETMPIDPTRGPEAWTPWTPGDTQSIEIYSEVAPAEGAVSVGAVLHMTASPLEKAAASCTLSTACPISDATLDAAIGERKKSVMRISFVENAGAFVCSATLIDTPLRPAAYVLTANHCIADLTSAHSITAWWFYEESACGSATPSPAKQVTGGMDIVFTNFNVDATLLLMSQPPPAGAAYAAINPALVKPGDAVVSISHPRGDTSRYAIGAAGPLARDAERPYDMYVVNFSQGIIEGGSSGSGLFTMNAGHLALRGILSQAALDLSCTNPTALTLYARLEALYPEIAQYIGAAVVAPDDAPNRPQDLFNVPIGTTGLDIPLDKQGGTVAVDNRRIDYPGDIDVFRFLVSARTAVSVYSEGSQDTVGTIHDSAGIALESNDDAIFSPDNNNFGITRILDPGTYYASVAHWNPQGTGAYNLRLRAEGVDANYTDLWWNAAESGWGVNVNHQGNTLFVTLFTYDTNGAPVWLVMSNGAKQADGSFLGDLYRLQGPAFNAPSWGSTTLATVGTMRLAFSSKNAATLTYTYNGTQVVKSITRQVFSTPPTCKWSAFDRSFSSNLQDLWWNPAEPGWGVNLTHQGNTIFATLFVYDASGRPLWLVMSNGARSATSPSSFSGALYRTSGPAFNASPWTATTVADIGTMKLDFSDGNNGTMTYTVNGVQVVKTITRQVFSSPKTDCSS